MALGSSYVYISAVRGTAEAETCVFCQNTGTHHIQNRKLRVRSHALEAPETEPFHKFIKTTEHPELAGAGD